MLMLKLEGESVFSSQQGQMLRQCCWTVGWRNAPGKSDPFMSLLCLFSCLLYSILLFDSVVTCLFLLTFMNLKAWAHQRAFHAPSLFASDFSLSWSSLEPWIIEKKSQHCERCPSLPVCSFLSDLCSECLESASRKFRLASPSSIIVRGDVFLQGFWLFQLDQPTNFCFVVSGCAGVLAPWVSPLSSNKWNLLQAQAFPNAWPVSFYPLSL